jgi:DNA-binding response OmpR family regulator
MMPRMDGYQLTQAMRSDQRPSHIPVILLTAKDDSQSKLQGWQDKADEYLTKPFDPQELQARIHNLLAIRAILRERFSQSVFAAPVTSAISPQKVNDDTAKLEAQSQFLEKTCTLINGGMNSSTVALEVEVEVVFSTHSYFTRCFPAQYGCAPSQYGRGDDSKIPFSHSLSD